MVSKIFASASAAVLALAASATATGSMLTSWYGPGFHGNYTANGEVYDQMAATEAQTKLPLGTQTRAWC